jgi:uncharacterized protein
MRELYIIALTLLIIGGLNAGVIALVNIDIVSALFGENSLLTRGFYGLGGLAAIYMIFYYIAQKRSPLLA